ncbi:hypothetical protein [Ochrobactrum chromiisoli]|uniref:Uncharacterized protein n=1 Tax=Ochrobactrum chromiisoli TaxID=2993941 RepID=A0ABT3QUE3_9HYPH|nr:hypothetical protein [Ochrobactrum chromiisoli]MCX2699241.1 hypothetical protein [Ochrobactrum chromiisoli]
MAAITEQRKSNDKRLRDALKVARRKHEEPGSLKATVRLCGTPNPHFNPAQQPSRLNPIKVKALVNIKESAVGTLYARGHINDAQWAAAGRFRMCWEQSGAKGAIAIDYGRVQVDGGKAIDPLPDRVVDATQQLNDCIPVLGKRTFDIMVKVVGQGMEITDIAKTQREKTTFSDYIKDGLEELAVHWGYKTR